jgi:hypothetical protein
MTSDLKPHGKERTMRHRCTILALALVLVAGFAGHSGAVDTSPYLVSDWFTDTTNLDSYSSWFIINPTPVDMVVVAAFYSTAGVFSDCVRSGILSGNDTWWLSMPNLRMPLPEADNPLLGVVKFFAFPVVRGQPPRFDPNAVIGGIKQEVDCDLNTDRGMWVAHVREVNLKAVTINSSTIGEFQAIMGRFGTCQLFPGTQNEYRDRGPQQYCNALPLPPP